MTTAHVWFRLALTVLLMFAAAIAGLVENDYAKGCWFLLLALLVDSSRDRR